MVEPFDGTVTKRGPAIARSPERDAARGEATYVAELEARAGLLRQLGYTKDAARARLQANLRWDFPDGPAPLAAAQVDTIVERVFGGAAETGAPRPR